MNKTKREPRLLDLFYVILAFPIWLFFAAIYVYCEMNNVQFDSPSPQTKEDVK